MEVGNDVDRHLVVEEAPADRSGVAVVERLHRVAEVGHVPRAAPERPVERRDVRLRVPERDEKSALHECGNEIEPARDLGRHRDDRASGEVADGLEERADPARVASVEERVAVQRARPVRGDERSLEVDAERHRAACVALAA